MLNNHNSASEIDERRGFLVRTIYFIDWHRRRCIKSRYWRGFPAKK
jgi:hypothetical protein